MTTIAEIADQASAELHRLYWEACDQRQAAINPHALGLPDWATELLGEAFEMAVWCENHPDGWDEARERT